MSERAPEADPGHAEMAREARRARRAQERAGEEPRRPEEPRPSASRGITIAHLLALACLGSAIVLGASEFGITFELVGAGGEPLRELTAADRHRYAMLVLAGFAVGALMVAVGSGSKAAAVAVAAAGVAALLLFLTIDLPKSNQVGDLTEAGEFVVAKAEPRGAFWLSLLGALGLATAGAALATLRPDQIALFGRSEQNHQR